MVENLVTKAPRLLHVVSGFPSSHVTGSRVFLWLGSLVLTFLGLYWVVLAPIVGDDLVFVTFGGLGTLWSDEGLSGLVRLWWEASVGSNHVTPLNGLVYVVQVLAISTLPHLGIPIAWAWGAFRLFWILLSLLAASWMLKEWFHYIAGRSKSDKLPLLVFFAGVSAVFMAMIQLRALWSNDSVLSYSVAAWLTAALAFLFLGLIPRIFENPNALSWKLIFLAAFIAITGILIYELMIVAIASGAFAILAVWFLDRKEFGWRQLIFPMGIAIILPTFIFLLTQYARTFWPSWYSGTQTGYADWVIPVTIYAVLNTFPLTNLSKALANIDQPIINVAFVAAVVVSVVGLFALFLWQLKKSRLPPGKPANRRVWVRTFVFLLTLFFMWVGSALVFAVSAKYQVELGTELGTTYLHYSFGILSLTLIIVTTLLLAWSFARWIGWILIVAIALIALAQASTNSIVFNQLNLEKSWTRDLASSQAAGYSLVARCELDRKLQESSLPQVQISAIRAGLYRSSEDVNQMSQGCSTFSTEISRSRNLTLN